MKVFCKRTYFQKNLNAFPVAGKNYGESYVLWKKGQFYNIRVPQDYEKEVGIYYVVESEYPTIYTPVKKKEFAKYFMDIDQLRDEKLNIILE
jgi:hypothetical protein